MGVALANLFFKLVVGRRGDSILSSAGDVLPRFAFFTGVANRPGDFLVIVEFRPVRKLLDVVEELVEASGVVHEFGSIATAGDRHEDSGSCHRDRCR